MAGKKSERWKDDAVITFEADLPDSVGRTIWRKGGDFPKVRYLDERGRIICVLAVAELPGGFKDVQVLDKKEIREKGRRNTRGSRIPQDVYGIRGEAPVDMRDTSHDMGRLYAAMKEGRTGDLMINFGWGSPIRTVKLAAIIERLNSAGVYEVTGNQLRAIIRRWDGM